MIKRAFDLLLAVPALILLAIPLVAVGLWVRASSPGPALYWSRRVGANGHLFPMPKFRSMRTDTPAMATHLLTSPEAWLTPIGGLLRRSSIDELPQLWSIIRGHMSIVGPRPALFNQNDLVDLRRQHGIDGLRPGLTGWAQVNGRDEISIPDKVALDAEYFRRMSVLFDLRIIALTASKVLHRSDVSH